jgi:signal transduction histidine kinase
MAHESSVREALSCGKDRGHEGVGVSIRMQDLVLPILAAGAVAAVIRTRGDQSARTPRGRRRELAWCAALLLISSSVLSAVYPMFVRNTMVWWALLIPLVAAIILAVRPRLAARIVPLLLILFGLFGYVVARDYADGGLNTYGITMIGNADIEADFILPQAYLFMLLGGWLTLRSADPVLARARLWLGWAAAEPLGDQLCRLLLLPVLAIAAGLFTPDLWLASGGGLVWTALVLSGGFALIRRRPVYAARLATAGVLCLGIAGLVIAAFWHGGQLASQITAGGRTGGLLLPYGAVLVSTQHTADLAGVEGLAFLALGAWLAPQTFPQVRRLLGMAPNAELVRRVQRLTESRTIAVDSAAADLRRLERDLHDGAQARLVALGMSLRAAERLIPTSPDAAVALVAEAREASARALTELRELVRGVLPPVLADRGLADAVRALALDSPLRVETDLDLPARLPAPVETACYFAVAEVLTNAAKHSGARDARIAISHSGGLLRIEVTDFGLGGADPARGSGLAGVEKRLATFDGILAVSSPAGGPTIVVMEVPCALSSLRTSSC